MARLYDDFVDGTTGADITAADTSVSSAGLADLRVVSGADYVYVTLDADGSAGAPEIIKVTSHTAAASSATIARGQLGTTARIHLAGTDWSASAYQSDFERIDTLDTQVAALVAGDTALDVRLDLIEANDWVTQARIMAAAVGDSELQDNSVITAKIAALAVTDAKLAASSVITSKILDANVTTAKLADSAVTVAKIAANTQVVLLNSAGQSVVGGTVPAVNWSTESSDPEGWITVPGTTLTIPADKGGLFAINFYCLGASPPNATYPIITTGSVSYQGPTVTTSNSTGLAIVVRLSAGATIQCFFGNAGSTMNYSGVLNIHRIDF